MVVNFFFPLLALFPSKVSYRVDTHIPAKRVVYVRPYYCRCSPRYTVSIRWPYGNSIIAVQVIWVNPNSLSIERQQTGESVSGECARNGLCCNPAITLTINHNIMQIRECVIECTCPLAARWTIFGIFRLTPIPIMEP